MSSAADGGLSALVHGDVQDGQRGFELVEALVRFVHVLRGGGIPSSPLNSMRFLRSVVALDALDLADVYWAGRCTLTSHRDHLPVYDRLFSSYFLEGGVTTDQGERPGREPPDSEMIDAETASHEGPAAEEEHHRVGTRASDAETLRSKDFAEWSEDELGVLGAIFARWALTPPARRSRRRQASHHGRVIDARRWLRQTAVHPNLSHTRIRRRRRTKPRRLVLLLDVSGSMAPYAKALLHFGAWLRGQWSDVEVFCFSTRLTRVTPHLVGRDPMQDVASVLPRVRDWSGGTRIGTILHDLNRTTAHSILVRGSVTILCSDGLERGDPDLLGREVHRLSRLTHQLVWVNPLKGDPEYQPEARGMAAALPAVDDFVSGRDIAGLEALRDLLTVHSISHRPR